MRKHIPKMVVLAIIVILSLVIATPAQAEESNSITGQSAYDDLSPDNLSFRLEATPAECEDKGGETPNPWSSAVMFTNLSEETGVNLSFAEGTGGFLGAGGTTGINVFGSGNTDYTQTVVFRFDVEGAEEESVSITIPAPESGCGADNEPPVSSVTCYLINFTDPSVQNEDHSYNVGTPITLEAMLTDEQSVVTHYVFSFINNDVVHGNETISGPSPSVTWTPSEAGDWLVVAQLFDENGNEVPSKGNCTVELVVKATAPPVEPPSTTVPTVVPTEQPEVILTTRPPVDANVQAAQELPRTGTFSFPLVVMSLVLVTAGMLFVRLGKKRHASVVDTSWSKAMATLGDK